MCPGLKALRILQHFCTPHVISVCFFQIYDSSSHSHPNPSEVSCVCKQGIWDLFFVKQQKHLFPAFSRDSNWRLCYFHRCTNTFAYLVHKQSGVALIRHWNTCIEMLSNKSSLVNLSSIKKKCFSTSQGKGIQNFTDAGKYTWDNVLKCI